jgi:hypothetical protein
MCWQLRDCGCTMPDDLCDWFAVARGSSYGTMARRVLRELGKPASITLRGLDSEGRPCEWTGREWVRLPQSGDRPLGSADSVPRSC